MTTQTLPVAINLRAEGGLSHYVRLAHAAPVLDAEQERQLAIAYREHDNIDAARQLVLSQLRYVIRVARAFAGYGLPQADLIQEGNIGLMKAVKHFDPAHGVRLVSFAIHWIRAEIYDYILRNWRIVKVATTKAQRKLFFNLRQSRARIGWMNEREISNLAADLNVPTGTVKEMESRMASTDIPFDAQDDGDDEEFRSSPAGYLQDMRYNPESLLARADSETSQQDRLHAALVSLDGRSRDIIRRRWLAAEKPTLHELAQEYGVSAERIRQIEKKALDTMKGALEVAQPEFA
ncbi:MAG: RNA polymerase sigma factor RpoH [Acidiferrobacter sp.]